MRLTRLGLTRSDQSSDFGAKAGVDFHRVVSFIKKKNFLVTQITNLLVNFESLLCNQMGHYTRRYWLKTVSCLQAPLEI